MEEEKAFLEVRAQKAQTAGMVIAPPLHRLWTKNWAGMENGYEQEFTYAYGAVSPGDGQFDDRRCSKMNTLEMEAVLKQVSGKYPEDAILMVVDGASSHKAKPLEIPANIQLIRCLPIRPSSIHRRMCGMKSGKRTFPTGSSPAWRRS